MREEFVRLATLRGANRRELMRRFKISPGVGYKWIRRYEVGGIEALADLSRRPHSSPRQTDVKTEKKVIALRDQYPFWGGRKLAKVMQNQGIVKVPSPSTITAILRRHGRLKESPRKQRDLQRFERSEPNELWQMDFKGDFLLGDQNRCYPLTACDDHSRFNIILEPCLGMKTDTVQSHLQTAFERYGLPKEILCDNGTPWSSNWTAQSSRKGYSKLEVWLMTLGVRVIHGRPYHPQTQGKEERFHRTLKVEVIDHLGGFRDLDHLREECRKFSDRYNWIRPHEALDLMTPGSIYEPSVRKLPEEIMKIEEWSLEGDEIRKIQKNGVADFRGYRLLVGESFWGRQVALRQVKDQRWEAWFHGVKVGTYSLANPPKKRAAINRIKIE